MVLKLDTTEQEIFHGFTYRIETPDGTMYVNIMENKLGRICGIEIIIGKAGAAVRAWAHTMSRLLTMLIEKGASIYDIIEEVSAQTTDRIAFIGGGRVVRSGPEGLFVVLTRYNMEKAVKEDGFVEGKRIGFIRNKRRA